VVNMNDYQKQTFAQRIIEAMFNTVTNKKICVFGFAFKKDTGDVRETPALTVCHMLMEDRANVHVYDPKVSREDALREFKDHGVEVGDDNLVFAKTPEEAVEGAHAIVLLTEWDEFKNYDYKKFYDKMMKPAFLFDGRNMLQHGLLEKMGYDVRALGKAKLQQPLGNRSLSDLGPDVAPLNRDHTVG